MNGADLAVLVVPFLDGSSNRVEAGTNLEVKLEVKVGDIPTTLTVWDLWTDPVGVAALLDVWGEKLGGPRAGV